MSEFEPQRTRTPRPRKQVKPIGEAVVDPMEYNPNKCTQKARKVTFFAEQIKIVLWCDKHYFDRLQHGDQNGARDGIDIETVKSLIKECIKPLMAHSSIIHGFTFLNYNTEKKVHGRPIRVVCQKMVADTMLNVIIEAHFEKLNEYEITIVTAMTQNDYRLGDGQFALEIIDFDRSILKKLENGRIIEKNEF